MASAELEFCLIQADGGDSKGTSVHSVSSSGSRRRGSGWLSTAGAGTYAVHMEGDKGFEGAMKRVYLHYSQAFTLVFFGTADPTVTSSCRVSAVST